MEGGVAVTAIVGVAKITIYISGHSGDKSCFWDVSKKFWTVPAIPGHLATCTPAVLPHFLVSDLMG